MNTRLAGLGVIAASFLIGAASLTPLAAYASSLIELENGDGPGEGLNDSTLFEPEGGNPGITLGEARMRAVEFAASLWSSNLDSDVPIRVLVRFDPLGGTSSGALLGLGGSDSVFRDFAGAPRTGVWYPSALADALAGIDLDPTAPDVELVINVDVDGFALGTSRFYYGFDAHPSPGDVDLVQVVLHELSHGLGFNTVLDLSTGSKLFGFDDVFMLHLERHGATPPDLASMTDAERRAAFEAGSDLHWTGPSAVLVGSALTAGIDPSGHIQMYAPSPLEPGASVTHFSTALAPDNILEPFYLNTTVDFELVLGLFADLGWTTSAVCSDLPLGQ
jgi:hypothetical protein